MADTCTVRVQYRYIRYVGYLYGTVLVGTVYQNIDGWGVQCLQCSDRGCFVTPTQHSGLCCGRAYLPILVQVLVPSTCTTIALYEYSTSTRYVPYKNRKYEYRYEYHYSMVRVITRTTIMVRNNNPTVVQYLIYFWNKTCSLVLPHGNV